MFRLVQYITVFIVAISAFAAPIASNLSWEELQARARESLSLPTRHYIDR